MNKRTRDYDYSHFASNSKDLRETFFKDPFTAICKRIRDDNGDGNVYIDVDLSNMVNLIAQMLFI